MPSKMTYWRGRRSQLAVGWVSLIIVVVLLATFRATQFADLRLLDAQFKIVRGVRSIDPVHEVALIGIDEKSLAAFPEPIALWHKHFADVLLALTQVNPAAVGLDIVLPDRSYEGVLAGADRDLIRGLVLARQSYPLVLGLTIDSAGNPRPVFPSFLSAAGPDATGFVLVMHDRDNVVRRFDPYLDEDRKAMTFVGQIASKLGLHPGAGFIDYSVGALLDYISMKDLLDAFQENNMSAFRDKLEGKVVLVGPVLPLEDRALQPVSLARWENGRTDAPGLLVHAQAVRSLGSGPIREVPIGLSVALALLATLVWFISTTPGRAISFAALWSAGVFGASLWLVSHGSFLPLGPTLWGLWSAALGRLMFEAILRLRQRRQLRSALAGYVGPQIVDEVMSGRLAIDLGGRRALICVLFTDIRGFTPRSEAMSPEGMVGLLNRYFEEVIDCVHRHDGTVAQLMGDGLMAIFGAPNFLANPSLAAFMATQEMFQRLEVLNERLRSDNIEPIEIGAGLNTGYAIVGHVGARARHEYTATGDVVNVAARLEALTKDLGYPLVCSGPVKDQLGKEAELENLGMHQIKGHSPILVHGWRKGARDRPGGDLDLGGQQRISD